MLITKDGVSNLLCVNIHIMEVKLSLQDTLFCYVLLGFFGGNSCQSSRNFKKLSENKPTKNRLEASNSIQKQRGARFIPHVSIKIVLKGYKAATKANHVLGLPIIVSTRRVEAIASKAMVSDEVPVLAKSRSEEGSQKPMDLTLKSLQEWIVLQEHSL